MPYPRQLEDRAGVDADEHARGARARAHLDVASPEFFPSLVVLLLAVADVLSVALGVDTAAGIPGDDDAEEMALAAAVVVPGP